MRGVLVVKSIENIKNWKFQDVHVKIVCATWSNFEVIAFNPAQITGDTFKIKGLFHYSNSLQSMLRRLELRVLVNTCITSLPLYKYRQSNEALEGKMPVEVLEIQRVKQ